MKRRVFVFISLLFLSIILTYFYGSLTIRDKVKYWAVRRDVVVVKDNKAELDIELFLNEYPGDYLMKLKYVFQDNQSHEVRVNGRIIKDDAVFEVKHKGIMQSNLLRLPEASLRHGRNIITIKFMDNPPTDVDITLSNYRKQVSKETFVDFKDTKEARSVNKNKLIVSFMAVLIFFIISTQILQEAFCLSARETLSIQLISVLPFLATVTLLTLYSYLSKEYRILLSSRYFWVTGLISYILMLGVNILIILVKIVMHDMHNKRKYKLQDKEGLPANSKIYLRIKIPPQIENNLKKIIVWLQTREFSDKCILFFISLLLICALFSLLYLEIVSRILAYIGYLSLFVGAVIKFFKFIKKKSS